MQGSSKMEHGSDRPGAGRPQQRCSGRISMEGSLRPGQHHPSCAAAAVSDNRQTRPSALHIWHNPAGRTWSSPRSCCSSGMAAEGGSSCSAASSSAAAASSAACDSSSLCVPGGAAAACPLVSSYSLQGAGGEEAADKICAEATGGEQPASTACAWQAKGKPRQHHLAAVQRTAAGGAAAARTGAGIRGSRRRWA